MKNCDRTLVPDDGFFFGLSVFETIGLEQGHPLFLRDHLERMNASAAALGIDARLTSEQVLDWLRRADHPLLEHGGLKIVLSRENLFFLIRENPVQINIREKRNQKIIHFRKRGLKKGKVASPG